MNTKDIESSSRSDPSNILLVAAIKNLLKKVPVNEENSILSLLKKIISDTATSSNTARSLQQPNAMSRFDSDNSSVIQVLDVLLLFSYLCRSFY